MGVNTVNVLAEELTRALGKSRISHTTFALSIGTSQQNVTRWANGEIIPSIGNTIEIADGLKEDRDKWIKLRDQAQLDKGAAAVKKKGVSQAELDRVQRSIARLTTQLEEMQRRLDR